MKKCFDFEIPSQVSYFLSSCFPFKFHVDFIGKCVKIYQICFLIFSSLLNQTKFGLNWGQLVLKGGIDRPYF